MLDADLAALYGVPTKALNQAVKRNTYMPDRLGRPDYAVHLRELLAGFGERKAPGVGADARRFSGRNREQRSRFSAISNILDTDGNEWALYPDGTLVGTVVRLSGDVFEVGGAAAEPQDATALD